MKDIRALDVKVFDTRKYTTPQKALHYATIFLYENYSCLVLGSH